MRPNDAVEKLVEGLRNHNLGGHDPILGWRYANTARSERSVFVHDDPDFSERGFSTDSTV